MKQPTNRAPLPSAACPEDALSAIHLEFIQNQAELRDGEGIEEVADYHRAVFLNRHATDLERFQQQARIHEDRLTHLDRRLEEAHARLADVQPLVPVAIDGEPDVRPSIPWNLWDRAMFGLSLCGIIALLVFGVFNISFNLLESGLVTFTENPVRAYFWSALLPVGALAVKVGWDFLRGPRVREVYLWVCLTAGIAGVLVWVGAYASVYPTLSKTTGEHLASLSVFDTADPEGSPLPGLTGGGAKRIDSVIVTAQAVAEIFLSAVLGMYLTILYTRHRPVRLAGNPLFGQLDEERREIEEAVARERLALAEARGNESRLNHQLSAFVAYARSAFERESARRRGQSQQQRSLLDQIAQQLQAQLQPEGADGNGEPSRRRQLGLGRNDASV
ncbi:MAG: hypothetical protein H7A47_03265 [Verrucomicrobiales bacterium]|nr:hypothetical protein [Verrucomicrobiales bacterium]